MSLLIIPVFSGALCVAVTFWIYSNLRRAKRPPPAIANIAERIAVGVRAYLSRQLKSILLITPVLAVVIGYFFGIRVAVTFVLGVFTSLTTSLLGLSAASLANAKTAHDASTAARKAFLTAVFGGSVMGFSVTGFSLLVLSLLYYLFRHPEPLVGFGFGASLGALFAQIGGGIFTKSADVGADLVGKVEKNIPEDDPRNPAVIADLVGDNVGDCAGRGADLFETISADIITGMLACLLFVGRYGPQVIFFPLLQQSVGLLSSLIGILSIRRFKSVKPETAFNLGMIVTSVIACAGSFLVARYLLNDMTIFLASTLGILTTLVAAFFTRYYAGGNGTPVKRIAESSTRGVALTIITGLGYGLQSPLAPIVMIMVAVCSAFVISGHSLLGIIAVNIGTDLLIGYIMTADAYGPIMDNAAGIAEMSGADHEVVGALSSLDAVGNTMKATTKAYAMSSGTITSFVLFATFYRMVGLDSMNISEPFSLAFVFLGMAMPFLISSLVIGSTAKTALKMVDEVRRQFHSIPGLMEGKAEPDYKACVDIATRNALKEMILPGLVSIVSPMVVGFVFRAWALGAFLIGSVAGSALLGPFFNNVGTAWDNAKKLIEESGQRGTLAHQAAVAADTIGDPLKDVAGPSLLIFMKLIGMAALLIAQAIR
jgi:K(+)-stimulated pyrophosphate-energized sodium pump